MAIFPGTKGGDILAWRGIAEVVGEMRREQAERVAGLLTEENRDLLNGLRERLEGELAFEEHVSAQFAQVLAEIDAARIEDDFAALLRRCTLLIEEYYRKRGSVISLHAMSTACRDALVCTGLKRVEEWLDMEGEGRPPAPYCWLGGEGIGRTEETFCIAPAYLLIHDDASPGGGYFEKFLYRAAAFLERAGLVNSVGAATLKSCRRVGRAEWRREITGELAQGDRARVHGLVRRADLRLIWGDASLAEEMIGLVRSHLDRSTGAVPLPALREVGREVAEMPTGLDFFNRLRVEKSGGHRGEFDLEQYGLLPLIATVRMLAVNVGLHATATIDRIKGLQERGELSVELTERLLHAYHDLTRLKLTRQLARGCEPDRSRFVPPHELSPDEEQRLRSGLEAVADLEKIAYVRFTEQG